MKIKRIIILLPIILLLLTGCSDDKNNINSPSSQQNVQNNITNESNSIAKRITVPIDGNSNNNIINILDTNGTNVANETNSDVSQTTTEAETELSIFSTEILTSDPNRNNNIQITCNTLNGHIVEPGETFSFTGLVGKSTKDKGYEPANIIEADGDTTKGLGGR